MFKTSKEFGAKMLKIKMLSVNTCKRDSIHLFYNGIKKFDTYILKRNWYDQEENIHCYIVLSDLCFRNMVV